MLEAGTILSRISRYHPGGRRTSVEIASGEQITEAEKERALAVLEKLCDEELVQLSEEQAKATARAVFHESVNSAAKHLACAISEDSKPLAREILAKHLKKHHEYPMVEQVVVEATEPVARHAALDAVRRWSQEKALPAAESAAIKAMKDGLDPNSKPVLRSAVLAGLRVLINGASANGHALSDTERNKIVDEYLSAEARKAAAEAMSQCLNAELLRNMQVAAEKALSEVASTATDSIAREEALKAAEQVAITTSKEEIARLILAEVQRRSAKITREFLQEEAAKQEESVRAQYCQEQALRLAKEAVAEVIGEVADPQVADLEMTKALELACAAASAVAREYSGAYEFSSAEGGSALSTQTVVILAVQIAIGCVLIWFFFLGGYDLCKPSLRSLLPPPVFRLLYPVHQSAHPSSGNSVEDLVDDHSPAQDDAQGNDLIPASEPGEQGETNGNEKGESSTDNATSDSGRSTNKGAAGPLKEDTESAPEMVPDPAPDKDLQTLVVPKVQPESASKTAPSSDKAAPAKTEEQGKTPAPTEAKPQS